MNRLIQDRSGGSIASTGRSLTVTDVCLCLLPIGLFLSIVSLV